jgi:uncharacterized protein YcbK (DUF882 family)
MQLEYFKPYEFEQATPPSMMSDMDEDFMLKIDSARHIAQTPFKITSAYRKKSYELMMGRDGTSTHTKGKALDIHCDDYISRYKIVHALMKVGFKRIIIYKSWIHVDDDEDKIKPMLMINEESWND